MYIWCLNTLGQDSKLVFHLFSQVFKGVCNVHLRQKLFVWRIYNNLDTFVQVKICKTFEAIWKSRWQPLINLDWSKYKCLGKFILHKVWLSNSCDVIISTVLCFNSPDIYIEPRHMKTHIINQWASLRSHFIYILLCQF